MFYFKFFIINAITTNTNTNTTGIHRGDVTHHHDQLVTWPISANFNVRNIKNNIDPMLILVTGLFWSAIFKIHLHYRTYYLNQ